MSSMRGRRALVTCGGSPTGAAIALELGRRGCDVLVQYNNNPHVALAVVAQIQAMGRRAESIYVDVFENKLAGRSLATKVNLFWGGRLDVLCLLMPVWNDDQVSLTALRSPSKLEAYFCGLIDSYLRSPIRLANALLPLLQKQSSITLVGLVTNQARSANLKGFGATKMLIEHFCQVWANELSSLYDCNVNCVFIEPLLVRDSVSPSHKTIKHRGSVNVLPTPLSTPPVEDETKDRHFSNWTPDDDATSVACDEEEAGGQYDVSLDEEPPVTKVEMPIRVNRRAASYEEVAAVVAGLSETRIINGSAINLTGACCAVW